MSTDVASELSGLRNLARSLVRGDADAEDLIQDTAVNSKQDTRKAIKTHIPRAERSN